MVDVVVKPSFFFFHLNNKHSGVIPFFHSVDLLLLRTLKNLPGICLLY